MLHGMFHHILQFRAIDFIDIGHITDTRWRECFLVKLDITVTGASICDIDINVNWIEVSGGLVVEK